MKEENETQVLWRDNPFDHRKEDLEVARRLFPSYRRALTSGLFCDRTGCLLQERHALRTFIYFLLLHHCPAGREEEKKIKWKMSAGMVCLFKKNESCFADSQWSADVSFFSCSRSNCPANTLSNSSLRKDRRKEPQAFILFLVMSEPSRLTQLLKENVGWRGSFYRPGYCHSNLLKKGKTKKLFARERSFLSFCVIALRQFLLVFLSNIAVDLDDILITTSESQEWKHFQRKRKNETYDGPLLVISFSIMARQVSLSFS